jgi:hypothetical protein
MGHSHPDLLRSRRGNRRPLVNFGSSSEFNRSHRRRTRLACASPLRLALMGFGPPQHMSARGVHSPWRMPPSSTVRLQGFSPSLRLAPPQACPALFHAGSALEVHPSGSFPPDEPRSSRSHCSPAVYGTPARHPTEVEDQAMCRPASKPCSRQGSVPLPLRIKAAARPIPPWVCAPLRLSPLRLRPFRTVPQRYAEAKPPANSAQGCPPQNWLVLSPTRRRKRRTAGPCGVSHLIA